MAVQQTPRIALQGWIVGWVVALAVAIGIAYLMFSTVKTAVERHVTIAEMPSSPISR
jgi:hypothetical protein